jgi:hypothetical protein
MDGKLILVILSFWMEDFTGEDLQMMVTLFSQQLPPLRHVSSIRDHIQKSLLQLKEVKKEKYLI